ncbi:hypothetical protein BV25DRAFT_1952282 [Artomyces pyxidatus]|uniref:Uncharacterized protein n=1 Tax=Artomyces pyxidatus TaxID=48021 RepID=A0ACB8TH07_9AGAM|nr:hypothetical protein BV25DRAFT_1952282 [Artomyces pyxidatus]
MPVPGFLSSFADKAQNAINNSSISQHIPGSLTGRPTATGSGDSASKNHTLEQIQHQFRQFQQTYSSTGPIQKLITTEKGVALDFDSVNRDAQAQSKELYMWGQTEASDVKDVSDRLAFLNYVAGALSNSLAVKLNAARAPLKALRDSETALVARRNVRGTLQNQISRIEHGQEKGYEKRLAELREQLSKAEIDDDPIEKEHEIMKRKALKESEQLKFAALREYGEKLSLLSQASEAILTVLPPIPPSAAQPYSSTEETGSVRAAVQHALDNWTPGQTTLSTSGNASKLDRSNTRSFGETHAAELSRINSAEPHNSQLKSGVPSSPPPGSAHPPVSTDSLSPLTARQTATSIPAPAPIPVQTLGSPISPNLSSPFAKASSQISVPEKTLSPTINPAELNHAPAPIPTTTPPQAVAIPDPSNPDAKVPSVTPTVAETGVPMSAGADGPGPASGSLLDIRSSPSTASTKRPSVSSPYGTMPDTIPEHAPPIGGASAGGWESAEDEKRRLQREERERLLHGEASSGAPNGGESAEDEKKRLEREEREKLLSGQTFGGPGGPPPGHPDEHDEHGDTPPPYQEM